MGNHVFHSPTFFLFFQAIPSNKRRNRSALRHIEWFSRFDWAMCTECSQTVVRLGPTWRVQRRKLHLWVWLLWNTRFWFNATIFSPLFLFSGKNACLVLAVSGHTGWCLILKGKVKPASHPFHLTHGKERTFATEVCFDTEEVDLSIVGYFLRPAGLFLQLCQLWKGHFTKCFQLDVGDCFGTLEPAPDAASTDQMFRTAETNCEFLKLSSSDFIRTLEVNPHADCFDLCREFSTFDFSAHYIPFGFIVNFGIPENATQRPRNKDQSSPGMHNFQKLVQTTTAKSCLLSEMESICQKHR